MVKTQNAHRTIAQDHRTGRALLGRSGELRRLEEELRRARSRRGTVLVLRGQAGLGKSTLLDIAAAGASGMEVVRFRGVESERSMRFAGLQLLCTAIRADVDQLEAPQRAAAEVAFGAAEGEVDPFLVGLAASSLLTAAARQRPTLFVVDDAHWLDPATSRAIAFALRRLDDHPIAVLLATRDDAADDQFGEFPSVRLDRLTDADACELLRTASFGRIDEAVLNRIVAEARGNPRAVLEVVDGVMSSEFAGGYGIACSPRTDLGPLTERVQSLGPDERRVLLLAAADPTGDPALQWRAAEVLRIDRRVARTLEDRRWLRLGTRVLFVDPGERSAVYRLATAEEREAAHCALAAATDPIAAPDRRAWHLASATTGLDDDLAAELERCAADAQSRSGRAGEAAFLERSALLTLDPRLRSTRALAAAAAKFDVGSAAVSVQLLATAELGRLDGHGRGSLDRQQARVAFFSKRNGHAAEQMLRAAQALHQTDERLACEGFLEALVAAIYAGQLGPGVDVFANKMPADWRTDGIARRLLVGLTARFAQGFAAGHRVLMSSLRAAARHDSDDRGRQWLWMAARIAADLWDDGLWAELTSHALDTARDTGSLMLLPYALTGECVAALHFGHFDKAQRLVEYIDALAASTRAPRFSCAALLLAGWRGDEQSAIPRIDTARRDALDRGEGIVLSTASLSAAVLYNGLGRYDAAFAAARDAAARDELVVFGWSVMELIEAAARTGEREAAACALAELTERTRVAGTDWALGIEARSRALLAEGPEAERLYQEAVERLGRSRVVVHLARAQLVYGEWLRRQGRRVDARIQLKAARESLTSIGATAFAERAHREYLATGDKARRRVVDCGAQLTPQEARITSLARQGLTNPEIGERLFLSPRTVEYHLHKVFEKLGISSRRGLLQVHDGVDEAIPPGANRPG